MIMSSDIKKYFLPIILQNYSNQFGLGYYSSQMYTSYYFYIDLFITQSLRFVLKPKLDVILKINIIILQFFDIRDIC